MASPYALYADGGQAERKGERGGFLLKMGGFSISIFMYFDVFRRISDVFLLVPVLSYFHVSLRISSYSDVFLKIHINTLRYTQIHCISTRAADTMKYIKIHSCLQEEEEGPGGRGGG